MCIRDRLYSKVISASQLKLIQRMKTLHKKNPVFRKRQRRSQNLLKKKSLHRIGKKNDEYEDEWDHDDHGEWDHEDYEDHEDDEHYEEHEEDHPSWTVEEPTHNYYEEEEHEEPHYEDEVPESNEHWNSDGDRFHDKVQIHNLEVDCKNGGKHHRVGECIDSMDMFHFEQTLDELDHALEDNDHNDGEFISINHELMISAYNLMLDVFHCVEHAKEIENSHEEEEPEKDHEEEYYWDEDHDGEEEDNYEHYDDDHHEWEDEHNDNEDHHEWEDEHHDNEDHYDWEEENYDHHEDGWGNEVHDEHSDQELETSNWDDAEHEIEHEDHHEDHEDHNVEHHEDEWGSDWDDAEWDNEDWDDSEFLDDPWDSEHAEDQDLWGDHHDDEQDWDSENQEEHGEEHEHHEHEEEHEHHEHEEEHEHHDSSDTHDEASLEEHTHDIHNKIEEKADKFIDEAMHTADLTDIQAKFDDIPHYRDVIYALEYRMFDLLENFPYEHEEAEIDPIEDIDSAIHHFHSLDELSTSLIVENESLYKEISYLEKITEGMEGHKSEMLTFYGFDSIYEETEAMIPIDDEECGEIKQVIDIEAEDYFGNASKANEASGHLKNTIDHLNSDLTSLREKIAERTEMSNSEKAAYVVTLLPKMVDIQHEFETYSTSVDLNLEKIKHRKQRIKEVLIELKMCAEHNYHHEETRI